MEKTEKEKVEKIAHIICGFSNCPCECEGCGSYSEALCLYKKGCRQASEVIKEFLEKIKRKQFNKDLFNDWAGPTYVVLMKDIEKIAEDMLKEIE